MMRYRVDLDFGYISFDEKDKEKAYQLYREEGIRIRQCENIYDDGIPIEGRILVEERNNGEE